MGKLRFPPKINRMTESPLTYAKRQYFSNVSLSVCLSLNCAPSVKEYKLLSLQDYLRLKSDRSTLWKVSLLFFQNEEIFIQLGELEKFDRITHA